MEHNNKPIGFVSSSLATPSNESRFSFIITKDNQDKEEVRLQQFDIVKVKNKDKDKDDDIYIYAIVECVSYISDAPDHIANYISYDFGHILEEEKLLINRVGFYQASARPFYQEKDDFFPVKTGDHVYLCEEKDLNKVLNADYENDQKAFFEVAKKRSYANGRDFPIFLNKKYLLGPDAAHLNISGMSGMAAKTTKAMHVLRELFYADDKVDLIIFNTKDRDLLKIKEKDVETYKNHTTTWSESIKVFIPDEDKDKDKDKDKDEESEWEKFRVKFLIQLKKQNLDLLVASDSDDNGNMDSCTRAVEQKKDGFKSWKDLLTVELVEKQQGQESKGKKENTIFKEDSGVSSIAKYKRILNRVINKNGEKTTGIFAEEKNDNVEDISDHIEKCLKNKNRCIAIVDIAPLTLLQQVFVFGCVIREIKNYCQSPDKKKKVAVFIDELNRYASVDIPQSNPILQMLIEIAETGRSNGLCLVTAEQSLSVIHKRIKSNIGTNIYGKTGTVELSQPDYFMIPESFRYRMTTFQHEDALISTPTLNIGYTHVKFDDKFWDENSDTPQ